MAEHNIDKIKIGENVYRLLGAIYNKDTNSVAFGENTAALGNDSASAGKYAYAFADGSIATGGSFSGHGDTVITAENAEESWNNGAKFSAALGKFSHTEGQMTLAVGHGSHSEGNGTKAKGTYTHAEGLQTLAQGTGAHAEGQLAQAIGNFSHAEGSNTQATGGISHAEGNRTIASNEATHAEGVGTIAASKYQHVQGKYNIEDGDNKYAHIVGNGTKEDEYDEDGNLIIQNRSNGHTIDWSGNAWFAGEVEDGKGNKLSTKAGKCVEKHAEIFNDYENNKATGDYSHAEGYITTASAQRSHAEGSETQATGSSAHAEGFKAKASGVASHAEGNETEATKHYAHAEGNHTKAIAQAAHASGHYTIADQPNQTVVGQCNVTDENALFIVGIGENTGARSNGFTVDKSGNGVFQGNVSATNGVFQGSVSATNVILGEVSYGSNLPSDFTGWIKGQLFFLIVPTAATEAGES